MKKFKKIVASLMAVAAIATSMVSIGASATTDAYPAEIELTGTSGSLKNNTDVSRYGVVRFYVYKRSSGALQGSDYNEGTIEAHKKITATVTGYASTTTYYHEASGSLYNGSNVQSGGWLSVSDNDL